MIRDFDAWVFARLLAAQPLNGELDALPESLKAMGEHLDGLGPNARLAPWKAMLVARQDLAELDEAMLGVNPLGPAPVITNPAASFATVADVRRVLAQTRWTWEGWVPAGRIVGVAAFEGAGKTRFLLDLARRIYLGGQWPDGQVPTLPAGTRTLWLCADGHQDELAEMLPAFGMPDEAVVFPAPPDEPYEGTDIDAPAFMDPGGTLESAIQAIGPGLVIIDTLTNATRRDLCAQDQMKGLKDPLVRLVQQYATNIVLSLHLNREGQALGRRIKGITRTLIHLECPDPEKPERLRLWVEKSYAKKPPALGVTIGESGNTYDSNPPTKAEPSRGGRPPEKLEKAIEFLTDRLSKGDCKAAELIREWEAKGESKGTIFNAKRAMEGDGRLVVDDSKKPQFWHLVNSGSATVNNPVPDHS